MKAFTHLDTSWSAMYVLINGYMVYLTLSENAVASLFRDGNGNFEFAILLYHPNNGQRSYNPQTKHAERMILLSSSQIYLRTYL